MKLGLSLAGGGIKGFAHIGAIKALEEAGIHFDYISGTSSGSIVAMLYACGYSTDKIHDIFRANVRKIRYVDFENIKRITKNFFSGKELKIDGFNSGIIIKNLVDRYCFKKGISNIKQIKMSIVIPAVNLCTEELYVFSNNIIQNRDRDIKYINDISVGTVVQASCSYPGIFSPCRFENNLLVDGGIAENLPWRETKKAGADKVLSIVFVDKEKKRCDNIYDVLDKSFSILCSELADYEWDGTDYLLKLYMPKVGLLAKGRQEELYELGYKQTKDKISDIVSCLRN